MEINKKINLLLVDDSEDHLFLTKSKLESEDPNLLVIMSNTVDKAISFLEQNDIDCIVSDYEMSPGMNGIEFYKEIKRRGINKPFIFLTGQGNEEIAREAFLNGVDDYFTKDVGFAYFTKLINAVRNAVRKSHTLRSLEYTKIFNRNIVNNMFEGFSVQDQTGRVLAWSAQLEQISGLALGDVSGKFIWQIFKGIGADLQSIFKDAVKTMTRTDLFITFDEAFKQGQNHNFPARVVPFSDEDNNVLGTILLTFEPTKIIK